MTTLNDMIRRRTANKYAGTKLGTQIANKYETGSRAGQNLNPTYQRGQKPPGWGKARYKSAGAAALITAVTPTEAGDGTIQPGVIEKAKEMDRLRNKRRPSGK
jgi:hypothetical protein